MEFVRTSDGSVTLFNEARGEYYHSLSGALDEAERKYVVPCEVRERAKSGRLRILDVCFGLGYNSAAAIEAALGAKPSCQVEVVGLELDRDVLDAAARVDLDLPAYGFVKKACASPSLSYEEGTVKVAILLGDARETIKKVEGKFDVVFFDPFSPKKQPELWSEEFFRSVRETVASGACLATYSCARRIRENLSRAGFEVSDGPRVCRRGPSTLARPR